MKNIAEPKKRAAGYSRVSTQRQVEKLSLDDQKKQIKEYCTLNNLDLINVYTDEGISGTTDKRAEFSKMLAAASNQEFSILIVSDNDRFGRNTEDRLRIRRMLVRDFGLELYSLKDGLFKDDATGRFQDTIKAGVSEYYRDLQVEKSASALRYKLKERKERNIGHLLYGLQWADDKKSAVHHHDEYPRLRLVIDLRLKLRWSYQKLAGFLNGTFQDSQGLVIAKECKVDLSTTYRNGRTWDYHKVRYICSLNTKKYTSGVSSIKTKYADDKFEYFFPPLISESEFTQLQKLIPDYIVSGKKRPVYLLSRKLICQLCDANLQHKIIANKYKGQRKQYDYYCCRNKIEGKKGNRCPLPSVPQQWLEKYVWHYLEDLFETQQAFEGILFACNEKFGGSSKKLNEIASKRIEIAKALEEIDIQKNRIVTEIGKSTITSEDAKKQITRLKKSKTKLLEEDKELSFHESLLYKEADTVSRLEQTRSYWGKYTAKLTEEQKKEIIDIIVDRIEIWPMPFEKLTFPENMSSQKKIIMNKELRKLKVPEIGFRIVGKVPIIDKSFYMSYKDDIS